MKFTIPHIIKRYSEPGGVVLMYHRVAEPVSDVWSLAVSPANFEAHLQVLKKSWHITTLRDLAASVTKGKVKKKSVAISFDDGYADNYMVAKPLLEKYELPATFFICTGPGKQAGFWWDELEMIIFSSQFLPSSISITIGDSCIGMTLGEEAELSEWQERVNKSWNACEDEPPALRCRLYLQLWEALKPLPFVLQQEAMERIRNWAGSTATTDGIYPRMTEEQLSELAMQPLFDVAAHTLSHAALASHGRSYQQQELMVNKEFLQAVTGEEVPLLSYPYGNYNRETEQGALSAGFVAAFTTEEKRVTKQSNPFRLGRFQVRNFSAGEFAGHIEKWYKTK